MGDDGFEDEIDGIIGKENVVLVLFSRGQENATVLSQVL